MNNLVKYSWLTTALILLTGFAFLHFKWVSYGNSFFTVFPFAVGFSIGTLFKKSIHMLYMFAGTLIFLVGLYAFGLEGVGCILMVIPIFFFMIFLGYLAQYFFNKNKEAENNRLMVSLAPLLLLLAGDQVEKMLTAPPQVIEIRSSKLLDFPPDLVFDGVKSMEKLDAEKSFFLEYALPVPLKCELAADTVGSKRYCKFENGQIVAQITRYEKGEALEMDVIEYSLLGRHWFQFVDAKYIFEQENGQTRITRTSSYKSTLRPRW